MATLEAVMGVTKQHWQKVAAGLLLRLGEKIDSKELAKELGFESHVMLAILLAMKHRKLIQMNYRVYHACSVKPVAERAMENGFQPVPWTCPGCQKLVRGQDELRYSTGFDVPSDLSLSQIMSASTIPAHEVKTKQ